MQTQPPDNFAESAPDHSEQHKPWVLIVIDEQRDRGTIYHYGNKDRIIATSEITMPLFQAKSACCSLESKFNAEVRFKFYSYKFGNAA
jgi:hypothetical protein